LGLEKYTLAVGKWVPNSDRLLSASGDSGIAGEGAGSISAPGGRVSILQEKRSFTYCNSRLLWF